MAKCVKILIALFSFFALFNASVLASGVIYSPGTENTAKKICVTGDSYAGYFCKYERQKGYEIDEFARAQHTVVENKDLMTSACFTNDDYLIISIGVNDHVVQTDPNEFTRVLYDVIKLAVSQNKKVFVHTYMKYHVPIPIIEKCNTKGYDTIIRSFANAFNNVIYIDMTDYQSTVYMQDDGIHYNRAFYDALFKKISGYMI